MSLSSLPARLRATARGLAAEVAKFGVVGAINYVVDIGIFNLLVAGPMSTKPVTSKAISTVVAMTLSYFMNRHWTWSERARTGLAREYLMFAVLSGVGLGITLAWTAFGEYVLDQHSILARNFWANIVGVGMASIWRFWSFKRWVFLEPEPERSEDAMQATVV